MTDITRTPGPWEVGESDTFGTRVRVAEAHLHPQSGQLGSRMYLHAQIALCREVTLGAAEANARLIAAAPELLALVNRAVAPTTEWFVYYRRLIAFQASELERLRAVEVAALRVASSRHNGVVTDHAPLDALHAALEGR